MKRVALVGATSQIAKDFIRLSARSNEYELLLFVRNTEAMSDWLYDAGLAQRYPVFSYLQYKNQQHEAVINFVGVGDPLRAASMGGGILDVTLEFDDLILSELKENPHRQYIFISSGAVYGEGFMAAANSDTAAVFPVNKISAQNYYAIAKLHAETRHRSLTDFNIFDVRVFNYFSRYQELSSRFFIVDVVNAIRSGSILKTSSGAMFRDFLHPSDFYQMISCLLSAEVGNGVVDCYTTAPVEKKMLLDVLCDKFGLQYEVVSGCERGVNATGVKRHYYSVNRKAAVFGYQPQYSSLETVCTEITALLESDS